MRAIYVITITFLIIVSLSFGNGARSSTIQSTNKSEIEQLFTAWNSHDPEKVAACFTEDIVYEDVAQGHISRGRDEVHKWAEGAFFGVEDLKFEILLSNVHKGHGTAEWIVSGTDKGLFDTGKNFSVHGVSIYEVRHGKISRYKEFYDVATIMRQVGVLPSRPK